MRKKVQILATQWQTPTDVKVVAAPGVIEDSVKWAVGDRPRQLVMSYYLKVNYYQYTVFTLS